MRPLNQYFIPGGTLTAIATTDGAGLVTVAPVDGRLVGVYMNVHAVPDAEMTFDIEVNTVDSGVDVVLPNAQADETGVLMEMRTAHFVSVKAGDALKLVSNQEGAAAVNADITWVLERDSVASDSEYYLRFAALAGIEGAVTAPARVCPFAGRIIGLALNTHTLIGTAAPPAPHTFDILKNNIDQNMDFVLPDATPDESGLVMGMIEDGGGGAQVYVDAADHIKYRSNAEQVVACAVDCTAIVEKTGEANLASPSLNEYILPDSFVVLSTPSAQSGVRVIPDDGEIVGLALSVDVAVDAATALKTRVNAVLSANDLFTVPIHAANVGVMLRPLEKQYVRAGDAITVQTDGATVAVSNANITWIIRR